MKNIMLDLETLGSGPRSVILSIGAVRFCLETFELGETFYRRIELESCLRYKLEIDAGTLLWWMQQPDEARVAAFLYGTAVSLPAALLDFTTFAAKELDSVIWGNGATFDNIILRNAYAACELPYPVSYRDDLCYRTVRRLLGVNQPKVDPGVAHNALDDAVAQAKTMVEIMRNLKGEEDATHS